MLRDELIKLLQEMPENLPVLVYDPEYSRHRPVKNVKVLKVQKNKHCPDTILEEVEGMVKSEIDESMQLDTIEIDW